MLSPYTGLQLHDAYRRDAVERAERYRLAAGVRSTTGPGVLMRAVGAVKRVLPHRVHAAPAQAPVVELAGSLDASTASRAREQLAAAFSGSPDELVVDIADVTSIDPAGIDLLVEAALDMNGKTVRFRHARPEVERELELAGLYAQRAVDQAR